MIIGPDGVGKTTLAARLIADYGPPSIYIHFRPRFWSRPPASPGQTELPPPKKSGPGHLVSGWLRLARSVALFNAGYWRWIRPAIRAGALVVGDRWMYGYVGQPAALGYGGPPWLARFAIRLIPRPTLLVRLKASPEVAASRKSDLKAAEIEMEDKAWDGLPDEVWVLDATKPVSELVIAVARHLESIHEHPYDSAFS